MASSQLGRPGLLYKILCASVQHLGDATTIQQKNEQFILFNPINHWLYENLFTRGGEGTKSVEHIRSEYPGCVGVQAKNEEVPQSTNSGIFGAKYRKINYFAQICL